MINHFKMIVKIIMELITELLDLHCLQYVFILHQQRELFFNM